MQGEAMNIRVMRETCDTTDRENPYRASSRNSTKLIQNRIRSLDQGVIKKAAQKFHNISAA